MRDENRTKKQLIDELKVLRQRVADSEGVGTERRQVEEALRLQAVGPPVDPVAGRSQSRLTSDGVSEYDQGPIVAEPQRRHAPCDR